MDDIYDVTNMIDHLEEKPTILSLSIIIIFIPFYIQEQVNFGGNSFFLI